MPRQRENRGEAERSEMAIPNWSSEVVIDIAVSMIVILATLVAVLDLFIQVAIIASCIWLAFMAWSIWAACKSQGGFRKWLINFLGVFVRKHFVESVLQDAGSVEIRFGYQLFGSRLVYFRVPLDKIETVEWSPGQAPRSWNVSIWFDHDDPEKSLARQKWSRKPDQDVYCVGPSRCKKRTEAFGLGFVDFLSRAGATLVRREDDWGNVGKSVVFRRQNGNDCVDQ